MELFIIIGLILLNGMLSMTEMALVSSRKSKLEAQAKEGSSNARKVLNLMQSPDKFLSTIQIGITLIGILTGIFSGESIQHDLTAFFAQFDSLQKFSGTIATAFIVIIVTYFTLVFGELVPKRIGLSKPEAIAKKMSPFMDFLSKVAYPFIWILSVSTKWMVKLLGIKEKDNSVTEEEIKAMISEGTEQGEIALAEQEIIERVFHLGDRNITSLMTHRSEIEWLEVNMDRDLIIEAVQKDLHSVYPLCENSIDSILGIVKTKDLYIYGKEKTLSELCRPALFVPENNTAYQVMEKFKAKGISVCFIVDEYGSLQGMVTLKDIFEAIVGDIPELDETGDQDVVKREDGTYWVSAQMHFYDFLAYFDCEDEYDNENEFDTLAGFILDQLKHIPKVGEQFDWDGFSFEIVDMDGYRIDKVLVKRKREFSRTP